MHILGVKENLSHCGWSHTGTQLPLARQEAQVHSGAQWRAGYQNPAHLHSDQETKRCHAGLIPFPGTSELLTPSSACLTTSFWSPWRLKSSDLPHPHPMMLRPLSRCPAPPPAAALTTHGVSSERSLEPQKPVCPRIRGYILLHREMLSQKEKE